MQLDSTEKIPGIVEKTNFSIFEIKDGNFDKILPKSYHAKLDGKLSYQKEDIDEIAKLTYNKESQALTIVIENAECMNESSANTFLKTLEQPGDNIHFVFLVQNSNRILQTIKSRAQNYYISSTQKINTPPKIDETILNLAKKYISATPQQLPSIASEIAKDKNDTRGKTLDVIDAAIQIMYKSYFLTENHSYLDKIDRLIKVHDHISSMGHIKLQLVAGML